jgi:hypothetical protein
MVTVLSALFDECHMSHSGFQQHLVLLAQLLKGNHDAAKDDLLQGAVHPYDFIRFVDEHRLQLCVFSLLDGSPARQALPADCMERLKRFALKQWAAQETLVRELGKLATLLETAGHEFILLKGPYLAERFFGGIDRRLFSDLDILVRRENLAAVESVLRSHGYLRKSTILFNEALTTRFTHAFDFANPKASVDLHWLLSANAAHALDYEVIWRQRQSFVLRNHRYFVLSDEYEVVFNLISIFKDLERGKGRLKAFVDLYFILSAVSRRLDWDEFFAHRKREKILRISLNILALFFDFFDCRERFPEVAAAMTRKKTLFKVVSSDDKRTLIEATPGALGNKLWAAGVYECSRFHVFLWWLVSLPFRLAVYDAGKYARFKRKLQRTKGRLWTRTVGRAGGSA